MSQPSVFAGGRYGSLVVMREFGRSADGHKVWVCLCDCGAEVTRQVGALNKNRNSSCGCMNKFSNFIHGKKGSPTYSSWASAKDRCRNPNSKDFYRYGAVGINFCDRWSDSFEDFLLDMGERPPGTTIDRIDNKKGYEPGNCRWATSSEQQRNRNKSIWVEWKGLLTHLSDIAKELGITYGAAFQRHKRGRLV